MGGTVSVATSSQCKLDLNTTTLICHSSRIVQSELDIVVLTERSDIFAEETLSIIEKSESFIVILDCASQRSPIILSLLSFIKSSHKKIFSSKFDDYYLPSGGTAAICRANGEWYDTVNELVKSLCLESISDQLRLKLKFDEAANFINSCSRAVVAHDVCVSFAPTGDGGAIANIVTSLNQGMVFPSSVRLSGTDDETDLQTIRSSRVLMFVITPETLTCKAQLYHMQCAIESRKYILPIKASGTDMCGWVALALAGMLYFEVDIHHKEDLYKQFSSITESMVRMHDSTPAIEIVRSANGMVKMSHKPMHSPDEVEEEVIRRAVRCALDSGVDQDAVDRIVKGTKAESELRPTSATSRAAAVAAQVSASKIIEFPSVVSLLPPKQQLGMSNIHYTKTRMAFTEPLDIRDEYGLPIVSMQLDCMISYEWHSQSLVLDLHQQFTSARAWFDVLGDMQGNMNTAMAEAVETVACVIVFVSEKYQKSVNCKLELTYAVACGKPLIFVLLEGRDMVIHPWLRSIMGEFDVYPLVSDDTVAQHSEQKYVVLDFSCEYLHGVPMANAISGIVLKYVAWRALQPVRPCCNSSRRVFDITSQLVFAQMAAIEAGRQSLSTCTRCGVKFNPAAAYDGKCRKHSAYYVGGNIIAGRWVCCSSVDKEGMGCCVANSHMTAQRTWYCDKRYGTFTWAPE